MTGYVLLGLLCIATAIQSSAAIQCYVCSSLETTNVTRSSVSTPCPEVLDNTVVNTCSDLTCLKYSYTVPAAGIKVRSTIRACGDASDCKTLESTPGFMDMKCSKCDKDKCNSAATAGVSALFVSLLYATGRFLNH